MVMTPYSGQAVRNAHFDFRPPPLGVETRVHDGSLVTPETTNSGTVAYDPFNPQPEVPPFQAQTVWQSPAESAMDSSAPAIPSLAEQPVHHWWDGQPPVSSGVETATRMDEMAARMMDDHSRSNYIPDTIRIYHHYSEGESIKAIVGRPSQFAGEEIPDGPLAGLQNGRNAYDAINDPNPDVYGGDDANVGRYRLGRRFEIFGLYQNPLGKFGQDAMLHAYTGIRPFFPQSKNQWNGADSGSYAAPYTPNSSGATAYSAPAVSQQAPSMFGLPSETAITDYSAYSIAADGSLVNGDFEDGGYF